MTIRQRTYELRKLWQSDYTGHLLVEQETQRLLGGVGHNAHRAWAFPLNTPRGLNTIQEYAFDHPFHNGVFVGQGRVTHHGDQCAYFWTPGLDWRQPENPIMQNIGRLYYKDAPAIEARPGGFRFTYRTTWRDPNDAPVLDEERVIALYEAGDAIVCDVTSCKKANHGALRFDAGKHGSIGVRVQPQLLPLLGGQIAGVRDGDFQRGRADEVANNKLCDFVLYENDTPNLGRFGICLTILDNSASTNRQGPWFIRDYGMAMFNATMTEAIALAEGETWTVALRVVAYDGAATLKRLTRWRAL